ncbi:MAG: Phosphate regulon sensor protein PhoR (SphS), partial [uncultured Gemmatimonadetes bacterium]
AASCGPEAIPILPGAERGRGGGAHAGGGLHAAVPSHGTALLGPAAGAVPVARPVRQPPRRRPRPGGGLAGRARGPARDHRGAGRQGAGRLGAAARLAHDAAEPRRASGDRERAAGARAGGDGGAVQHLAGQRAAVHGGAGRGRKRDPRGGPHERDARGGGAGAARHLRSGAGVADAERAPLLRLLAGHHPAPPPHRGCRARHGRRRPVAPGQPARQGRAGGARGRAGHAGGRAAAAPAAAGGGARGDAGVDRLHGRGGDRAQRGGAGAARQPRRPPDLRPGGRPPRAFSAGGGEAAGVPGSGAAGAARLAGASRGADAGWAQPAGHRAAPPRRRRGARFPGRVRPAAAGGRAARLRGQRVARAQDPPHRHPRLQRDAAGRRAARPPAPPVRGDGEGQRGPPAAHRGRPAGPVAHRVRRLPRGAGDRVRHGDGARGDRAGARADGPEARPFRDGRAAGVRVRVRGPFGAAPDLLQPDRQRHPLRAGGRAHRGDRALGGHPAGQPGGPARVGAGVRGRQRRGHPFRPPPPHLRALLPRRRRPLARGGGHRPGPGHRQAPGGGARRHRGRREPGGARHHHPLPRPRPRRPRDGRRADRLTQRHGGTEM